MLLESGQTPQAKSLLFRSSCSGGSWLPWPLGFAGLLNSTASIRGAIMSQEATPSPGATPNHWPPLDPYERRVLGVLVEKAKTTPDAYPLSLNALVTGCNQKSNRDPIMNISDLDAETTLEDVQKKGFTIRISGSGRVERWRHNLYDAWSVGKVELAILAELLLRGPQTEGELRQRASRMEEIPDLDTLRDYLRKLAERNLVVYLTPEGRRGTTVTHGFHAPHELMVLKKSAQGNLEQSEAPSPPRSPSRPPLEDKTGEILSALAEARTEITELKSQIQDLRQDMKNLEEEITKLKEALGI